jgi:hypothetical protein
MKQWHPLFVQLLRPVVEDYYEVQTTVPVGDAPREADLVLLRRTSRTVPPFHGLWRHLTAWNVLEFKGPSVAPRREDLELLVELGLGIDRRLRRKPTGPRRRRPVPEEVSFWYLANQLGKRFLQDAERKLGPLAPLGPGLWRSHVLLRLVFLVSGVDLPVEEESLPLHVIGNEPPATERAVAQLVVEHPQLQSLYGGWLATIHPTAWEEVEVMARTAGRAPMIDLRPVIEKLGLKEVIRQAGVGRVIEHIGMKELVKQIGTKELVKQIGIDDFLANLSLVERQELKRRLR